MVNLETELRVDVEGSKEGEMGVEGNLMSLGVTGFLTQEAKMSGTMLVDYHNGFNELSRLAILWTVRHYCPAGDMFVLKCYKHWVMLLICQPEESPVMLIIREGVTQGDPL